MSEASNLLKFDQWTVVTLTRTLILTLTLNLTLILTLTLGATVLATV